MFTRKILVGASVVAVALAGFVAGRGYDDFAYPASEPGFENQREMAVRALTQDRGIRDGKAYARDLERMKVDYVTLRQSFCTRFTPPSGVYWHSIIVCFDKSSKKSDIFRY